MAKKARKVKRAKKKKPSGKRGRKAKYGLATAELIYPFWRDGMGSIRIQANLRRLENHKTIDASTIRRLISNYETEWEERREGDFDALVQSKRKLYVELYNRVGKKLIDNAEALIDHVADAIAAGKINPQLALQYQAKTVALAHEFLNPVPDAGAAAGSVTNNIDARQIILGSGPVTPSSTTKDSLDELRERADNMLAAGGLQIKESEEVKHG